MKLIDVKMMSPSMSSTCYAISAMCYVLYAISPMLVLSVGYESYELRGSSDI